MKSTPPVWLVVRCPLKNTPRSSHNPQPVSLLVSRPVQFAVESVGLTSPTLSQPCVMQRACRQAIKPLRPMGNRLAGDDDSLFRKVNAHALGPIPAFKHRTQLHFHPLGMDVIDDIADLVVGRRHGEIPILPSAGKGVLQHRDNEANPIDVQFPHAIHGNPGLAGAIESIAGVKSEGHPPVQRYNFHSF